MVEIRRDTLKGSDLGCTYTLSGHGLELVLSSFGATWVSLKAPSREGAMEEVTLNHSAQELFDSNGTAAYYGSTCGRVANRIAMGRFTLDGTEHNLAANNGPNALHGGLKGFDKHLWTDVQLEDGVRFSHVSDDGDEGYPGQLSVSVSYRLAAPGSVLVEYEATTTISATIVNLTNHTYFNLSGDFREDIRGHTLQLSCSHYLPVDQTSIPTGELRLCATDASFDFVTRARELGASIDAVGEEGPDTRLGIDHCFCVDVGASATADNDDTDDGNPVLHHMATLRHEASGRQLIVRGSQPGLQVYTANWLSQDLADAPHVQHNAIALETQGYPDAVNQAHFPSVVLRPGEIYRHVASYDFSAK